MQIIKKLIRYKINPLLIGILLSFIFLGGLVEETIASVTCTECEELVCDPPSCSPGCSHTCTPCDGTVSYTTTFSEDPATCSITVNASCSCGGSGSCTDTKIKYCKPKDSNGGNGGGGDCPSCGRRSGGGGSAGGGDFRIGSVDARFSLGPDEFDGFIGFLWIYTNSPSMELATPEGLRLIANTEKLEILTEEDNTNILRQVKSPACLADVVWPLEGQTSSVPYYRIDFYRSADIGEGTNGYYQPNAGANPFAQYYIENMSGLSNTCEELRIRGGITGGITTNIYTYQTNENQTGWSLSEAGGLKSTEKWSEPDGTNGVIDTETVRDSGQNVVSVTRKTYRAFAWGTSVVEKAVDPDGANLRTTASYYENEAETGKYMRANMLVNPDGSWKKYDYDGLGRRTKEIHGWLNVATNAAENEARVIDNDYTPVDGNDDGSVNHFSPRTVTEKIEGVVVAKTYHTYYENEYGEQVEIEEKCAAPSSAYGSTNNLRETKIYYPKSSTAASSEQIKTYEYSNGRRDNHTYEYGTFLANADPAQASFTADSTGECVRVTSVHDTLNGAVAGKTTKETFVYNAFGRQLIYENYACTDGTNYARVGWSVASLDDLGRRIRMDNSNGTYSEATWSYCGCGKEWEKDESGIEYSYTYDALKRLIQKVKSGTAAGEYPAQANQYTTYTYDAEGRQLTETVSASSLSQGRTNQYDMAGRMTNSSDFTGLSTTTTYSQDGLTTTETLPGGYTRITERYKDGQMKSITGTAQISQYYDYGINEDGSKWTTVYSATADSPVWVKTTTDLLGHTAKIERPGYSGTETTEYTYNSKGQLIRQTVDSGPSSVVTLYAYDEVGNQIRSGLDANANGELDLAGTDRVTESDKYYELISDLWYLTSVSRLYATDNSADATTNSVTRERLTGFSGNLVAEIITIDAYGNQTVSQTTVDRNNKKVTQTVNVPNSSGDNISIAVNGLLVSSQRSTLSAPTLYSYDSLGRRTGATDPRLGNTVTHYDSHGWVDYVEDAGGRRTSYTYDSATGRKISQTDPLTNTSYSSYSSYGQLEKTWGSAVYPVQYSYDAYGRMSHMSTYRGGTGWSGSSWPADPGTADTTEWIYHEASGLLTAKKDSAGKQVSYTYSAGGKLATRVWARVNGTNSLVTSYSYNSAGDLDEISYSDSTPDISFTYDRLGRQKTAESDVSSHTFAYNGLLLDTETIVSSAGTNIIDRSYDSYGRSTGFNLGSDYQVAYGFNILGRFSSVSFTNLSYSSTVSYSYLQNSDLISTIANGDIQTTRTYEQNRNLLTQIKNQVNSTILSQFDYANDSGGRRTSIKYSGSAFETGAAFNKYGYNSRSEVTSGQRYWGANLNDTSDPVSGQSFGYAYDNIGNRNTAVKNGNTETYTANSLNQYDQRTIPGAIDILGSSSTGSTVKVNIQSTSRHGKYWHKALVVTNSASAAYAPVEVIGIDTNSTTNTLYSIETGHVFIAKTPEQFTHNDDGNLLSDGRFAYTWDCEGRLVGANTLTNLPTSVPLINADYSYDYMSRRSQKVVGSMTNIFVYDGWLLVSEQSASGGNFITNRYVWGLDLSGTLQGAGGVGGLRCVIRNGVPYYPCYDGNGNIIDYVNTNGVVVAHREYDPFGNTIVATGPMVNDFHFWFSTKYLDQETGLYYYGYRYYSPSLGRFLSRDPIGEEALLGTGSINLDGLSGQPNSLNANGAQQELINTLKDPDVFEKILKDPIKLRQVINALEEKRGPDCVTQFLKKTILEQTADHPYLFVKNNPVGAIDSLGLFVFPNPFPDIPSVPWPLNMLPPCSGPASGQAGRQDDECSWPAGSFNSNPCLKKCCKDHDDCYTRNGCNMFSWIPGCGSVACKACNAKVAACFAGF